MVVPAVRKGISRFAKAAALGLALLSGSALAADPGGDLSKQQPKYVLKEPVPPAPILSPEDELKTFKLPPGFRAELVASEPQIDKPVALAFDPDGRIYVVEMRAYMPDAIGTGELDPKGRISRLEDKDGDGKYESSTVFMDGLIIPRSVGLAGDGVLIAEPPNVWFCKDKDGDGKSDEKTSIATDYGTRMANPEHLANGLVWMLDNWCYSANWAGRFKYVRGKFSRDGTIARGQWGISQDDAGRFYYNTNSSILRADLYPAQYMTRNPYLGAPAGVNVFLGSNKTFPGRVNPGVNRGYTATLDMDAKLASVTAACGPVIYRADAYPEEYRGNAFICEPSGNMIIRQKLEPQGANLVGTNVQSGNLDFMVSTDERFRPVNMYTAPDGTLYVVDLYHGILQHKAYLSSYLADQIKKRDLDKGGPHGRIWRIVHEGAKPGPAPKLSKASNEELVKALSHPNGWWRDTAQRLLVEKRDRASEPLLRAVVESKESTPLGRVHALWTLQGMEKLDEETVAFGLKDADSRVRIQALRLVEPMIRKGIGESTSKAIIAAATDADPAIQLQFVLIAAPDLKDLYEVAKTVISKNLGDKLFRAATLNAAAGRELQVLQALIDHPGFASATEGKREILNDLAECVMRARSSERVEQLLDLIAALPEKAKAEQAELLGGMADAVAPNAKTKPRMIRMPRQPEGLAKLQKSSDKKIASSAEKIEGVMSWPNKPGDKTPPLKPLTPDQEKRFAAGRELFALNCAGCHQATGLGQDGTAPPLVDSEWVLGSHERPARILLHGLTGPIKVGKRTWEMEMPSMQTLTDEQIASVLTYIRREWSHEANPVDPETIAKIRKETADRGEEQWTEKELLLVK